MTHPNRNTLWARTFVDELARTEINAVCIAPGSRSTPLVEAFDRHDDIETFSHLDERSAAYFALGRARRTGKVTPIVCTSGTAAANFHPAVIEASQARVPMLVLTADRPPEIRDSGANQTIDQEKLYGDAVRWYKDMPEPEATDRKLRSLRTTAARAISEATGVDAGPVHLNFPFRKPLEPTHVDGDVPADLDRDALDGRDGSTPYVRTTTGAPELSEDHLRKLADELTVDRGLIVAGPADPPGFNTEALAAFAHATGFPIVADPLSGLRFGGHTRTTTVLGGYDAYLDERVTADWPDPDVVVRIGASPTSKPLRKYLARTDARQYLVDPTGQWREAEFTSTDLVEAEPSILAWRLSQLIRNRPDAEWNQLWTDAEDVHWDAVDAETDAFEGRLAADVADLAPEPSTIFVSNSMPVRELDRFARPSTKARTVLGNRGASGIDGIVSSALGAGSASTDHLTLLTGDLAYYHDMNGLLALGRLGVDATIVLVNNDGGGIFHMLPIEDYEPPFTDQFKTPHGLDFSATEGLYDLSFESVEMDEFRDVYAESVASDGTDVIEVRTDAESSHRVREDLRERVVDQLTN
ncbi:MULTISPECIES: 2-succinyl-5-enolpyruvyl-6-hydroxy-3-cyclohexene-1-carboxylic-acid synthase [Haloferax]|uniref:2-succinyl-5-enolpyruvyl-6-hydroxy-3-cyclohexene-1-carboxylate synthase n=2 Tax=Haloferax TaxID=2251 RepID=A0A6G1Z3R6_9EURY|nr:MULTISPECIES: 2-succinyl-5-enolpyruvyl-6-hydroxy-3-cyclohexene-1-carboxylic-acid synthase [Haloferax]KAB1188486.1 2-succinyl-5-enolpyruvyl-6-hydroxy-3-cyclohexene-1-carboxylic-acid synthase [Haloferax sp. CBA1149]MRW81180.1 2-succinyl-5-enolpyruvyl-6-hydroxy-3-cyclohexene-1-carboxylic-acid synthase [Haloferax marinisediminis]